MQAINGKIKPEIGYHIHKNYQKRGYATEAAIKNGMKLVEEYEDPVNTISKVYAITRSEWEKGN